jgi:NAD(P)H-hydrate repair Nnr-like enzyme with NAD(P)H-hydrate dehydratase domain
MSTPSVITEKLNEKKAAVKDHQNIHAIVIRFALTREELTEYFKKVYYQGWNDCADDKHNNAETFINSLF